MFASGSPFDPFTLNGKTYYTGQGNNAYIFPGVAMAILTCGARHIPEVIFLRAAQVRKPHSSHCSLYKEQEYLLVKY